MNKYSFEDLQQCVHLFSCMYAVKIVKVRKVPCPLLKKKEEKNKTHLATL